jgi:hypothetical protein
MSKTVNDNDVDIYFKNLVDYINISNANGNRNFLKETKFEMLYLLLKNAKCKPGNKILNSLFIDRLNETIRYCNILEYKRLLNEVNNNNTDPTYDQMVNFLKRVFKDVVDEFDINGGIYWFASRYYDGQFSNLYRAIGQTRYKPGAMEKGPMDFTDYEYEYLLYNIQYDMDSDDDAMEELPDRLKFSIKKSEVLKDGSDDIDANDLQNRMTEYISEVSGYLVESYEYRFIGRKIVETDFDVMNAVYKALVDEFASVKFDVGGKHDDLPPGEHYELPPGTKENKTNMNENKISIREVKNLINEVIAETLQSEVSAIDYNDYEPIDTKDDFAGDYLRDLSDTANQLIKQIENETGDYDKAYDRLVKIYKHLTRAIDNPRLSSDQRKKMAHEYDGILGNIHRIIGGGGAAEKFYMKESESKPISDKNRMLIIKWCESMGCHEAAIRMIDSVLKTSIGLSSADLADTSTFANGVDSIEDALKAQDYQGAYEMAKDTASEMVAEEGGEGLMEGSDRFSVYYQQKNPSSVSKTGGWRIAASFADKLAAEKFAKDPKNKQEYGEMSVDVYDSEYDLDESLFECDCWEQATKHPQLKGAILKEKAPPGMENWIKSNKQRFKSQYGDKKGTGALYATAWKMFYKKKNK